MNKTHKAGEIVNGQVFFRNRACRGYMECGISWNAGSRCIRATKMLDRSRFSWS